MDVPASWRSIPEYLRQCARRAGSADSPIFWRKFESKTGTAQPKKERQKRSSDHRNLDSRSKLRSSWRPAAACVLFVQHSPEKAQRHRQYERFFVVSRVRLEHR